MASQPGPGLRLAPIPSSAPSTTRLYPPVLKVTVRVSYPADDMLYLSVITTLHSSLFTYRCTEEGCVVTWLHSKEREL